MITGRKIFANKRVLLDSFRIVDTAALFLAGLLSHELYLSGYQDRPMDIMLLILAPVATGYAISLAGGYDPGRSFGYIHALRSVTVGGVAAVSLLVLIGFSFKISATYSRVWLGLWLFVGWSFLIAVRCFAIYYAKRYFSAGLMTIRAVVLGRDPTLSALLLRLAGAGNEHIEVLLRADLNEEGTDAEALGALAGKVTQFCSENMINDVVMAVPGSDNDLLKALLARLQHIDCNIDICVEQGFLDIPLQRASTFGGLPILRILNRPIDGWGQVVKWLEDKLLGLFLLILALPLMVLIALCVKLGSAGPVFFYQRRLGRDNQEITIAKFRTMHVSSQGEGPLETSADDARVTRVGRVLRRFSLDELPQLFNVVLGSMSLVGPRPHAVALNEEYAQLSDDYWSRHRVKPGITGWAQILGYRGETKCDDDIIGRVQNDIRYIENWSIWLDLYIILRTVEHVLKGENAY